MNAKEICAKFVFVWLNNTRAYKDVANIRFWYKRPAFQWIVSALQFILENMSVFCIRFTIRRYRIY